jgi:hypothetical protein
MDLADLNISYSKVSKELQDITVKLDKLSQEYNTVNADYFNLFIHYNHNVPYSVKYEYQHLIQLYEQDISALETRKMYLINDLSEINKQIEYISDMADYVSGDYTDSCDGYKTQSDEIYVGGIYGDYPDSDDDLNNTFNDLSIKNMEQFDRQQAIQSVSENLYCDSCMAIQMQDTCPTLHRTKKIPKFHIENVELNCKVCNKLVKTEIVY